MSTYSYNVAGNNDFILYPVHHGTWHTYGHRSELDYNYNAFPFRGGARAKITLTNNSNFDLSGKYVAIYMPHDVFNYVFGWTSYDLIGLFGVLVDDKLCPVEVFSNTPGTTGVIFNVHMVDFYSGDPISFKIGESHVFEPVGTINEFTYYEMSWTYSGMCAFDLSNPVNINNRLHNSYYLSYNEWPPIFPLFAGTYTPPQSPLELARTLPGTNGLQAKIIAEPDRIVIDAPYKESGSEGQRIIIDTTGYSFPAPIVILLGSYHNDYAYAGVVVGNPENLITGVTQDDEPLATYIQNVIDNPWDFNNPIYDLNDRIYFFDGFEIVEENVASVFSDGNLFVFSAWDINAAEYYYTDDWLHLMKGLYARQLCSTTGWEILTDGPYYVYTEALTANDTVVLTYDMIKEEFGHIVDTDGIAPPYEIEVRVWRDLPSDPPFLGEYGWYHSDFPLSFSFTDAQSATYNVSAYPGWLGMIWPKETDWIKVEPNMPTIAGKIFQFRITIRKPLE